MILFDIDGTLSPTRVEEAPATVGETARAFGFQTFIPQHLLDFLRNRDDIALLSTWGPGSFDLPKVFDFKARIALIEDFSDDLGIKGKFEVVKALNPTGWADDHITPNMAKYAKENGIVTTKPRKGYVTEVELDKFIKALEVAPARVVQDADAKLYWKKDLLS